MPKPPSKPQRSLPSSLKTWLQKPHPRLKKLAVAYALLCTALYFQQQRLMFFPSATLANTPSLYQLPYEDVWIPVTEAEPAEQLHGWWIPAENPEAPVLLYFHHNAANIGANVSQALQFHKLGYAIFLFDYRGFGQSEGSFPTEAQVYEDALVAWDYLTQTRGIPAEQIVIYGHSVGGAIAIDLAAKQPDAAALIVHNSFTSMMDMTKRLSLYWWLPMELLLKQRFESVEKMPSVQMPVLIITGTNDLQIPVRMGERLHDAAPGQKQFILVEGGGHDNHLDEQYTRQIKAFVEEAIATGFGSAQLATILGSAQPAISTTKEHRRLSEVETPLQNRPPYGRQSQAHRLSSVHRLASPTDTKHHPPPGNVMGQPGISAIAEQASFGIARRLSAPLFILAGTVAPFSIALLSQAQTSIPSSPTRSPLVTQAQFPAREPSADKQAQVLAKAVLSDRDQQTFQAILTQAQTQKLHQQPFPTIIQTIAEQFLGSTYTAGLLDQGDTEELIVSLSEFDCVLFIEAVLALAQSVATQNPREVTLVETVEDYRYRDGQLGDYCDRLHYFSDWIFDNEQRGNMRSIAGLNSDPFNKPLTFMSSHRNSYPQLKASTEAYDCIAQQERKLNQALTPTNHRYIPTHRIRANQDLLQAGDVVAIATSISGLDVTHTGLAYENPDGSIGLIHAAPGAGVKLSPDLQWYVERVDSAIGIMVTRPVAQPVVPG